MARGKSARSRKGGVAGKSEDDEYSTGGGYTSDVADTGDDQLNKEVGVKQVNEEERKMFQSE